MIRKYFLIGFLISLFSLTIFATTVPKFKVESFIQTRVEVNKTAIFVGDRFKLKLEIIYPKDWGIEILTEDLEKDSMAAVLPESLVLEKAKVSKPRVWNKYWLKIEAVYNLFYPEKKHTIGILVFPQWLEEREPFKIRFKVIDRENRKPREEIKIYEVEVKQFVEAVRSTLTSTSDSPRDSKVFFGHFGLKSWLGLTLGIAFILLGLSIPVRLAIRYSLEKRSKELSVREVLKKEFQKLNNQISDSEFRQMLRKVIGKKAGFNALALTASEIKEKVGKDNELITLALILEKHDELAYNMKSESVSKAESIEVTKKIISEWMTRDKWYQKLFRKIKEWRIKGWRN